MKITNKNIGYWILGIIFLVWCKSMFMYGIPEEKRPLEGIELFNLIGVLGFGFGGLLILIYKSAKFLFDCDDGTITFEIDLLAPFRPRYKTPEEEDKEKK